MAIDRRVLVTEDEHQKLKTELAQLVNVRRPEIAHKIGRAAADGDLSENGAYHDAKEQQGHVEGRIQELEYLVRNAVVVEPQTDRIGLGSVVDIKDEAGIQKTYRLVSKHGANPSAGMISDESPIGRAMLDHTPGETISYQTPNGQTRSVTILSIR